MNEQMKVNKQHTSLSQRKKILFILHYIFYLIDKFGLNNINLGCLIQKEET